MLKKVAHSFDRRQLAANWQIYIRDAVRRLGYAGIELPGCKQGVMIFLIDMIFGLWSVVFGLSCHLIRPFVAIFKAISYKYSFQQFLFKTE